MGIWNRTFTFLLCLASVEAQVQVAAPPVGSTHVREECGYESSAQMDDARLLVSFVLGFLCMHGARQRWGFGKRREEDPDGFGNFDFLEEETPLCQMAILKLGL